MAQILSLSIMKGKPTQKNTHPNKSTICANNFGTICTNCPPFPCKTSRQQPKRACTNCLCILFFNQFFIWVFCFGVGCLPLILTLFADFCLCLPCAKRVDTCQKLSWQVFDIFWSLFFELVLSVAPPCNALRRGHLVISSGWSVMVGQT